MERVRTGKVQSKRRKERQVNGERQTNNAQMSRTADVTHPIRSKTIRRHTVNGHFNSSFDEKVENDVHYMALPIDCDSKVSKGNEVVIIVDSDDDVSDNGLGEQKRTKIGRDIEKSLRSLVSTLDGEAAKINPELLEFRKCFNPFNSGLDDKIAASKDKNEESLQLNECTQSDGTTFAISSISNINLEKHSGDEKVDSVPACMDESYEKRASSTDDLKAAQKSGDVSLENPNDIEYEPYYWANFKLIISYILSDSSSTHLFNKDDTEILDKFNSLNELSQQLYVRLFLRKNLWMKVEKLKYPKIGEDLRPICLDLIEKGFLDDKNTLEDISEILDLMSASEVCALAHSYNLFKSEMGEKLSKKIDFSNAIMKLGNKQKSIFSYFSQNSKHSMKTSIIQRAKKHLGDCVKTSQSPREVFNRCFSLFSLINYSFNDDDHANSTLVYRMLQIKKGELAFPSYAIKKTIMVFCSRIDNIRYSNALLVEEEFETAMEKKDFDLALKIYKTAKSDVDIICSKLERPSDKSAIWSTSLPIHLRRFSAEWVLFRICIKAVDALEKKACYHEAVDLLMLLLSQLTYCLRSRGSLWDRLAIDTERYLKDQNKALDLIKIALNDPWVRTGLRLNLVQRAKRICNASKNKHLRHHLSEFEVEELKENIEVTISAPVFLDTSSSPRTIFLLNEAEKLGDDGSQSYSAVENYALSHYREIGFPNGVHAEGSSYAFIFTLIFWDIIFMDVDDVFLGPYQPCPLDLYNDQFYEVRKEAIDAKLQEIRKCTIKDLRNSVRDSWWKHDGQVCLGCNWNIFEDVEQVLDVVTCLTIPVLAGICELFCKDYRNRGSGMPDLLVWNSSAAKCKAVEVKGPGDRLSNKQIIWLNVLRSLGMDAEVCHVKGVGGRKRRLSKN